MRKIYTSETLGKNIPNLEDATNMHNDSDFIFILLKKKVLFRECRLCARHCARYSTYIWNHHLFHSPNNLT